MKHISQINVDRFHKLSNNKYSSLQLQYCHPRIITSYPKLIRRFAFLSSENPKFQILYRGQSKDYRNEKDQTNLFPSIYRPPKNSKLTDKILKRRFRILNSATQKLSSYFSRYTYPTGMKRLVKHRELAWSILQHYGVCLTPLLDVTPELDIALSFAVENSSKGVIYAFGVSNDDSPFTHNIFEDSIYLKLSNLLPATALRAFFQKACFIGTWPIADYKMKNEYNLSRRLMAIIKVDKQKLKLSGFYPKNDNLLFPRGDKFLKICNEIKKQINEEYS